MALSLDTTYMRLDTCMALFQRWRGESLVEEVPGADASMQEVERWQIRRAMRIHDTKTDAAESLGISRKSLFNKRKAYGLP